MPQNLMTLSLVHILDAPLSMLLRWTHHFPRMLLAKALKLSTRTVLMRHTSSFVNCFWLAPFFVKLVLCDLFGTGDTDHSPDDKLGAFSSIAVKTVPVVV